MQKSGEWKAGVQGYLASIHFADAMLGNVLDALDQSPRRKNTIVVLWSDHGWHLGEKEHWQKFTGWRACSRVPMMILAPGINPSVCDQPVSTIDLFKTLTSLSGITAKKDFFVSINPSSRIPDEHIIKELEYGHPLFDLKSIAAQKEVPKLNAADTGRYFCGAWQRFGFHEDGLWSAFRLCEQLLGRDPWS
ncbi:sulfatase-like hydrolase/transferase [Akkermansiaceae bacterium]|nr:sulfatase-like hydrolase/transferase [Akkermansiaceae bacterium]